MDIARIIKIYFFLILASFTVITLSYNENVNQYLVSVFGGFETQESAIMTDLSYKRDSDAKLFSSKNQNTNMMNFSIQPANKSYAFPGEKLAEVMTLIFKSADKPIKFDNVRFKVVGISTKNIRDAYLYANGEKLADGRVAGQYVEIENINYEILPNSRKQISLKVNLDEKILPGNRLRFDLEKSEDLKIYLEDEEYRLNGYYPVMGPYLSIVPAKK